MAKNKRMKKENEKIMETKGIDLTKCHNLRAKVRAKTFDGKEEFSEVGRIVVDEKEGVLLFTDDGGYVDLLTDGEIDKDVLEIEIIPRDPETYEDWQVGDKITKEDNDMEVIFRSGELVICRKQTGNASSNYTCRQLFDKGYRLVLTDIEKRIIGEKKYEPQDGDIVAWKCKEDEGDSAITIFRGNHRGYFTMFTSGKSMGDNKYDSTLAMDIVRPATDEEKQLLFDAMAKEGKRWNAEKKVVEDIPKPYEFKKGEPVLVRDDRISFWRISTFRMTNINANCKGYVTENGQGCPYSYRYCLPYNEKTMHLLGTSEDYKEGE